MKTARKGHHAISSVIRIFAIELRVIHQRWVKIFLLFNYSFNLISQTMHILMLKGWLIELKVDKHSVGGFGRLIRRTKGAVAIRINYKGIRMVFVSCHLSGKNPNFHLYTLIFFFHLMLNFLGKSQPLKKNVIYMKIMVIFFIKVYWWFTISWVFIHTIKNFHNFPLRIWLVVWDAQLCISKTGPCVHGLLNSMWNLAGNHLWADRGPSWDSGGNFLL